MSDLIRLYAEKKIEIARLTEELKGMHSKVFEEVMSFEGEKLNIDLGEFIIINGRKRWKYSDELIAKEKKVLETFKIKKREEELKGIAIQQDSPSTLVFKVKQK